jgi:mannose-6-phosphate isomerase-like protein (cupin superfamily)
MKFTRDKARKFGWQGMTGWAYMAEKESPAISCAYIEVSGRHGKVKYKKSDRLYYVISGSGAFKINEESQEVREGDVLIIPKDTPYDYEGEMKLLLVDTPAYDSLADVNLE